MPIGMRGKYNETSHASDSEEVDVGKKSAGVSFSVWKEPVNAEASDRIEGEIYARETCGGTKDLEQVESTRLRCASNVLEFPFNMKRVRLLSKSVAEEGTREASHRRQVIYWMCRDQRVEDNWAFLYAQRLALEAGSPLCCCFVLLENFLNAPLRHYDFMIRGLRECEKGCGELGIPFCLLYGTDPAASIADYVVRCGASAVVTDFSPLRTQKEWIRDLLSLLPSSVPLYQVDAHNVVPCWITSDRLEIGAKTIRRKIHANLAEFLTEFPPLTKHPHVVQGESDPIAWDEAYARLKVDASIGRIDWAVPGYTGGLGTLFDFMHERLPTYAEKRNNPNEDSLSNLSPWLHFGQLSAQRAVLEVSRYSSSSPLLRANAAAFIEEAVVRRELSDNFCHYNENYDRIEGAWPWARQTLREHERDKRQHVYSEEQFENASTHDDLWNAAQRQMVRRGKMHGFLRMYWAKKILEWSKTPCEALKIAIYLNDRYSIDGRDPNGYVGCMWSICGVHDQGWAERPIYGKIRSMTYEGCKKKFDVKKFVSMYAAEDYGLDSFFETTKGHRENCE